MLGAGQADATPVVAPRVAQVATKAGTSAASETKNGDSGSRPHVEQGAAAPDVAAAARAIRRALDTEEEFSSATLKVIAGNRRVIVEGTVATKKLRAAVIHAATKAAPGSNLDFMLQVSEE